MKSLLGMFLGISMLVISSSGFASDSAYDQAVTGWQSHEDVGKWLNRNFSFDKDRQKTMQRRLKSEGPSGLLARAPDKFFENSKGYCADSANFAQKSLNRIDPKYNARWVFVENAKGRPNHWVTAFDHNAKLYIMDYGAGEKWRPMQGVHGPYDSLGEYRSFLASLSLPGFEVGDVVFRTMPGKED